MTRENLAEVLEEIALLLELKGENPFKIRAYRQGADTVRSFEGEIVELAEKNELTGIKGIGEALRDKLHELASTGHLKFHENLRAEFPPGLFELFDVQGLGPKKVKALYDVLGISSIPDLKAACESGKIAGLPGFGAKTQTKLLEAISLRAAEQRSSAVVRFRTRRDCPAQPSWALAAGRLCMPSQPHPSRTRRPPPPSTDPPPLT